MIEHRYYLCQPGKVSYQPALEAAFSLAQGDFEVKQIVLLSATLRIAAALSNFCGKPAENLEDGSQAPSPALLHEALFSVADHSKQGKRIIIAYELNDDQLVSVDELKDVKHLIAVPESCQAIEGWIRRWSPDEIQADQILRRPFVIERPSAVVREALDELSTANRSSRMLDPSDKARAKTYARALFKFEPGLDPDQLEPWLLRAKSWCPSNAAFFCDLLRRLIAGRSFKGGELSGLAEHYRRWLGRASARSGAPD